MWPRRRPADPAPHERALFQIGGYPFPFMYQSYNRVAVTQGTAASLSAVWRCLTLLCDVVSTLPIDVYRTGTRTLVDKPQLLVQPAADLAFDEWVWIMMWEALTSPAAWGLVVDRAGPGLRPSQIEPLARGRVTASTTLNADGLMSTVYRLGGREVDRSDLFKFRLYPAAGSAVGLDPVAYAAEAIGAGIAAQRFASQFFSDSAIPSGVLTTDAFLTAENAHFLKERWDASRQGMRDTAVLGNGLKFQPIAVSPEESLETRKFSIQEACRYFGVPPEMIGAHSGDSLTYANVEQRDLDFLKYGAGPKLTRLEARLNQLLPRGQYCKFNTGALLRTDLKTRYESYALALGGPTGAAQPWLTVDEVRGLEDREPIDPPARPATLGVVA
jgi:HK97 family phage portal protein